MKKQILSLFMAFVLCLTLLPTAALAASGDGSISDGVIDGSASTGEGGGIYAPPGSPTEGGGGTYIPGEDTQAETQPVTVISGGTETGYDSIVTAFSAAVTGGTVRLNADVSLGIRNLDDGVTADTALAVRGKNITLDLNGYVLGSDDVPITVKSGAGLTLINANGENSPKYASTPTALKIGLRLDLLVEKGASFTCTDGMFQSLKLLSAGTVGYGLKLAEGENHCTFGYFLSEDNAVTVDDALKANHTGMALHAAYNGFDVQLARSTPISSFTYYSSFYVGPCSEHKMDADGTCDYCGASYAASVTASSGESTSYTSLDDALKAVKDGDTVTLLSDAEVTMWHPLTAAITLDLNGKTVTIRKEASLSICARVIVQDSSTDQTGKMYCATAGDGVSHVLDVQEHGDLIIRSGIFDGEIWARSGIGSALTIEGGTFNKEVALEASVSISLSGGEFNTIWYIGNGSFLDLLADGYAFYATGGKLVNASKNTSGYLNNVKVQVHEQHTFTDGACGCGYTCPHTSVDANGVCAVCKKQFAASVTAKDGSVTYYDAFYKALNAASAGSTLTLLTDVTGTTVMINDPLIFDLNGHNVDALSVDTKATIKDSGMTKGKIGTLSIHNNTDPDADTPTPTIVLGDLMTGGDSLKTNGTWLTAAQLFGTSADNVSVDKTGITGVTANAPESVVYGQTGTTPITLTVTPTDIETLTFEWFELKDNNEWSQIPGAGAGDAYHPANLNVGSHTIRCATRSTAGYVLSDAVTVTVTQASIADADVTLVKSSFEYDGVRKIPEVESVTLSGKTLAPGTDYSVEVTPQTDAGSYTLTVIGMGNYSGEVKDIKWKIEPIKIDSVMVSSDISKVYDGTAEINMIAKEWAKVLTFKTLSASGTIDVPSDAYTISDAYFVEKRGEEIIHSPDAGEKYGISFKITLNSKNYVLQNYYDEEPAASKEYTQSGGATFTITKAAAPTNIQTGTLNVINGTTLTYTYDAKQLLPGVPEGEYGTVLYAGAPSSNFETGYAVSSCTVGINSGVLTLTIDALNGGKVGKIGSVTIYVTTDNYETFSLPVDLYAINQITPEPNGNITATEITYGDALGKSEISGKMKDPNTGTEVKGTFAWTDSTVKPSVSKNGYKAEWTFTPDAPEYASATGKVTVKVDPKSIEGAIVTLEQDSFVYDGIEKKPQIKSVILDGVELTGPGRDKDYGYSCNRTSEVGTYNDFIIGGQNNYTGRISVTWSITPREVTPVIEVADGSYVYDEGKEIKPAITVKDDLGNIIDPKEYEVSYSNNTNAGTEATVTVTDKSGGNYVLGTASKTFQIAKANSTAIAPTANDLTYNGKNQALVTASTANGGTMVYRLGDSGEFVSNIPTGKDTGVYTVYYKIAGDDNHYDTAPQSITVTIKQAKVTVTAENRRSRVGQPLLELTYTCEPALFDGDAFTGALACEADKDMTGNYEITQGTLTLDGNYELTFIKGTYTVTEKLVQDNFRFSDSARTVTYGDADFTLAVVGAADGSTVTYSSSDETVAAVDSTGKVTIKGAGNAKITAVASETADYDAAVASYDLTVNKAVITIAAKNQSAHVGDTVPALGADSYTVTGLVNGEQLKAAPTVRYVDDSGNEITPDMMKIGKVRIAVSGAAAPDGNNYIISYVDGVLTITSRPSSGSSTTVPVITVPVSSDKETVKVGASVSNGVADVRITKRQLEQVTADTDSVTVDVSGLQNVSSAKLPSAIVEKVGQSGADLTVTLPTGSVTLDATALAAVGNGKDMTISVQKVALTNAQRDAVGTLAQVAAVVDVNVLTGAAKCSSFNGGKLTVSIPYTLKAGEDPTKLQVWFIRDDGSIENKGGSYDSKTGCFVFSTEHLSCYLLVSTAGMQRFADVPASAYYAEAIVWAVKNGITGGTSATTFDPNGFCTRAQAVTFLWRAAGSPTPKSAEMPFADVLAGSYYYDAVLWAIENGITNGTSDTTFGPNVSCSRGQIVTFLWRSQNSPDTAAANPFTDVAADAYYTNAVLWAVGKSITSGISTTTFSPSANCTRAQIVTFLCRMYREN